MSKTKDLYWDGIEASKVDDNEPDYNPANFVPIPLQELNQLIKELGDSLPF